MVARITGTVEKTLPKANRKAKRAAQVKPVAGRELKVWAYSGVGITLAMSAGLNGLAFAQHAPSAGLAWGLGIGIPVLILVFSRVSALLYGMGRKSLAYAGAAATLSMLLLSVQHCAASISRLTGENLLLAGLMALAIDAGLVVCELATVKK